MRDINEALTWREGRGRDSLEVTIAVHVKKLWGRDVGGGAADPVDHPQGGVDPQKGVAIDGTVRVDRVGGAVVGYFLEIRRSAADALVLEEAHRAWIHGRQSMVDREVATDRRDKAVEIPIEVHIIACQGAIGVDAAVGGAGGGAPARGVWHRSGWGVDARRVRLVPGIVGSTRRYHGQDRAWREGRPVVLPVSDFTI